MVLTYKWIFFLNIFTKHQLVHYYDKIICVKFGDDDSHSFRATLKLKFGKDG